MEKTPEIIAPAYALNYINLVKGDDPLQALSDNGMDFLNFLQQIPAGYIDYAYAEGKWTIKESLQHIIDAERVFTYRALWFARKDSQPLPGFDESTWGRNTDVTHRNWHEMMDEFSYTRKSTIQLFTSFGKEAWEIVGVANNNRISVIALCYICAGHVQHHMQVISERYLHA